MRVLVVDDSSVARAALRKLLLARGGVEIVEAASSAEARAGSGPAFDGALLDLELGDGTGVEVFDALRDRLGIAVFVTAADEGPLLAAARARAPVFAKPAGLADAVAALFSRC